MDTEASSSNEITQLLHAWQKGETDARDRLIGVVYPQLRSLAMRYMSGESSGHTLNATGLVHEAYIKILGSQVNWDDRVHFFAVAARIMRHILARWQPELKRVFRQSNQVLLRSDLYFIAFVLRELSVRRGVTRFRRKAQAPLIVVTHHARTVSAPGAGAKRRALLEE